MNLNGPPVYADRLLEPDEIKRVTGGLTQGKAQVRALKAMQIPMRVSPAGEPLVLLSSLHPGHVEIRAVPNMGKFRA